MLAANPRYIVNGPAGLQALPHPRQKIIAHSLPRKGRRVQHPFSLPSVRITKRKLNIDAVAVPPQKLFQRRRYLAPIRAALTQLLCHLLRRISRPAFAGVEADDPDRVAVLTIQEVAQQRAAIGILLVRLAPSAAEAVPNWSSTR
jgi:hypothetical protein